MRYLGASIWEEVRLAAQEEVRLAAPFIERGRKREVRLDTYE